MRNLGKGSFLDTHVPLLHSKLSDILTSRGKGTIPSPPGDELITDSGLSITTEDPTNYVIPG